MGPLKRMALNWAARWVSRALAGEISHARIMGMARHGLTTLGGLLIARGVVDTAAWEAISGIALSGFGVAWSMIVKQKEPA